jgi:hypothetical protein
MSEIKDWGQYREALQASYNASNEELKFICDSIDSFLSSLPDNETFSDISDMDDDEKSWYSPVKNHEFLNALCHIKLPISVLQTVLDHTTNIHEFTIKSNDFSDKETRFIVYDYNINYVLSHTYGKVMRKMYDDMIDVVEYVEKVLDLLGINESEIDWDYYLKKGMED